MDSPEESMLDLAPANEDGSYTAKKYCAGCGDRESLAQGGLITIAPESEVSTDFCKGCLRPVLLEALRTKPFRPAEIAGDEIPAELVLQHVLLIGGDLHDYELKAEEFATPASRRLYCADRTCGAFLLRRKYTRRVAYCIKCFKNTCKGCGCRAHWGVCKETREARKAQEKSEVAPLADEHGWKFCPFCGCLIEMVATGCGPLIT